MVLRGGTTPKNPMWERQRHEKLYTDSNPISPSMCNCYLMHKMVYWNTNKG